MGLEAQVFKTPLFSRFMKQKVLFVCNQNKNRSRTAEELFKGSYDTRSAGLYNQERPLTKELVDWTDAIVVFEETQKKELLNRFPEETSKKRVINLEIPDIYDYNVPPLIKALKKAMNERFAF